MHIAPGGRPSNEISAMPAHSILLEEDPSTSISFLEALASVCVSWRGVMSAVSAFWTCLVAIADQPSTIVTVPHFLGKASNRCPHPQTSQSPRCRIPLKNGVFPLSCNCCLLTCTLAYPLRQHSACIPPRIVMDDSQQMHLAGSQPGDLTLQSTLLSPTRFALSASASGPRGS